VQQQLIPPVVPELRSLMQPPIDMQEMAAAAATLEAGSYGYGSTKESGYGTADAAAGWRRMLLQQADAAFAPLLQPGSYSDSSTYSSAADSADVLAEATAAGSYGDAASNPDEGLGYGSTRKLLQPIEYAAGSYGSADAAPAGSYGDAASILLQELYGGSRRFLQDSTGTAAGSYGDAAATGSYGDASAITTEGLYGGSRRLLQDSTDAAGSYGDAAAAGSYGDGAATTTEGLYGGSRRLLQDSAGTAGDGDTVSGTAAVTDSNSNVVLVVDVPGMWRVLHMKDLAAVQNATAAQLCCSCCCTSAGTSCVMRYAMQCSAVSLFSIAQETAPHRMIVLCSI
jgi:hypothetical protein